MKLRGYQSSAVADLRAHAEAGRRVVAVAPTGSGKTVIAAALIASMPNARVLWLAHRIELLRQARRELSAAGIALAEVGILSGPEKTDGPRRVLLASVPMFVDRGTHGPHEVPDVDIVVVDEAHRTNAASYQRVLSAAPCAAVIGLTATPWRLDGQGLGDVYEDMLLVATPTELIADGHIAHPVTYGLPYEKAREMVADVEASMTDYNKRVLGPVMMRGSLMGDVVSECARLAPNQRTIVFAVTREHGKALAVRFQRSGRPTAYLDSETRAKDRDDIVARLEAGTIEVVVNIDVLSEGFDCPPVQCIAIARPTRSLTRFLQYAGRAARPFEGRRPIILDHAGNCWRHGLPESEREWSLEGRERPARTNGREQPVRLCPECGAHAAPAALACPECGTTLRGSLDTIEYRAELERLAIERDEVRARLEAVARERQLGAEWVDAALARICEAA